ncbi:hypothetical protein MZK47_15225 [Microbacterium aerolatum]|uniref:hypothetical protein n=1 Tax=Microbacterium aerolatum TaxID=153731 RepID=UPI00200188AA|nr:hypothetical protein [Microbacterium aerolatum]MCK3771020.1 hypothetical protein [Microbacterium aerolatum]
MNNTLTLLGDVLWASAILILSIGLSREGSVVARKPLGVTASAVVAVWPLTTTLVSLGISVQNPGQASPWQFWMYLSMLISLTFGLIAAVQVARIRVVPAPWNLAPLWALGVQTVVWVVPQLINVAAPATFAEMGTVIPALGTLGFLATTLGLGVVAIVLSNRSQAESILVFESSPPE